MSDGCNFSLSAVKRLPTLQRNALRKIFDRVEFSPEEVMALGYRRLQQAEGIGQKGLSTIIAWLKDYGYELEPIPVPPPQERPGAKKTRRNIEYAMRLLRTHGYVIQPAEDGKGLKRPA